MLHRNPLEEEAELGCQDARRIESTGEDMVQHGQPGEANPS